MSMVQGTVTVDDDGNETYTPNDATNYAKVLYLALLAVNSTAKMASKTSGGAATVNPDGSITPPPPPTTTIVTHTITPTPQSKQKTAEMAVAIATVIPFIVGQAEVTITIPASSAGDGLQTSQNSGSPTTHPSSPKTMAGGLT